VILGHKPVPPLPRSASAKPPSASLLQETRKPNHSRTYGPLPVTSIIPALTRYPGGGGCWSYQFSPFDRSMLRIRRSLARRSFSEGGLSPLFPLHAKTTLVCLLFPLHAQKRGAITPVENVGAPTFLFFPLIFRTSLWPVTCPPQKAGATQPKRARQAPPLQRKTEHESQATPPSALVTGRWSPATGHLLCYPIHRRLSLP